MLKYCFYRIFFTKPEIKNPFSGYILYTSELSIFGIVTTITIVGTLLAAAITHFIPIPKAIFWIGIYLLVLILAYQMGTNKKFQKPINLKNIGKMTNMEFFYNVLFNNRGNNAHDTTNLDNIPFHITLKDGSEHYGFFFLYCFYNFDLTTIGKNHNLIIENYDKNAGKYKRILFFERSKGLIHNWLYYGAPINDLLRWKNADYVKAKPEYIINPNDIVSIKPMVNVSWWALIDDYIYYC